MRTIYATAQQIATVLRIPVGTVHRWASEDGWNRDSTCRPVLYVYEEACIAYARRESARAETLTNIATGQHRRLAS